jgi:hypothetical protein
MYNQEKMNMALRAFDWPAVLSLLPTQTLESLRELLGDVSRRGCLIRVHSFTRNLAFYVGGQPFHFFIVKRYFA